MRPNAIATSDGGGGSTQFWRSAELQVSGQFPLSEAARHLAGGAAVRGFEGARFIDGSLLTRLAQIVAPETMSLNYN